MDTITNHQYWAGTKLAFAVNFLTILGQVAINSNHSIGFGSIICNCCFLCLTLALVPMSDAIIRSDNQPTNINGHATERKSVLPGLVVFFLFFLFILIFDWNNNPTYTATLTAVIAIFIEIYILFKN